MADPFVAEIRITPFNFAPRGWAMCNGQLLPISQNTALFSLLGNNVWRKRQRPPSGFPTCKAGRRCIRARVPACRFRDLGEEGGSETTSLIATEMPVHTHSARGTASWRKPCRSGRK